VSFAYWNGRLIPARDVRIDPADAGFLLGDGLFETLRVDGGRARDVEAHLDRLLSGLQRIGIDVPETREALAWAVGAVAQEALQTSRLRITVTRGTPAGSTRLITAAPYEPPAEELYRRGVSTLLLPEPWIDSRSPLAGLKSLSYQANRLALLRAEAAGAFEALLLNERGRLAEGSRSNVIVALADGLFTPPAGDGCLAGTVRRRLLEQGAVAERSLGTEDLHAAREVLLTNSLIGVLPVGRIDGGEIPVGRSADRLRRLLEL
jgi:branched-chain amino acid aminotransferase